MSALAEQLSVSRSIVRLLNLETCRWPAVTTDDGNRSVASSQDVRAVVRHRLTVERQANTTLLPDFTPQATKY